MMSRLYRGVVTLAGKITISHQTAAQMTRNDRDPTFIRNTQTKLVFTPQYRENAAPVFNTSV